jgi:hypothetical protein
MQIDRRTRYRWATSVALAVFLLAACGWASDAPQVGEPRVVSELSGLQSCRFLAADAPDSPGLICSRLNEAAFSWEIVRVPLGDDAGEPAVIAYGRQVDVRGSKIAWVGTEPGDDGVWFDDLADDRPPVRLTDSLEMSEPSISADGDVVAVSRITANRTGIYLLRPGRDGEERLSWRDERRPVWGPKGAQMLALKTDQVWLLEAPRWETLVSERLTDRGMVHFDPAWGPRGEWITYAAGWTPERAGLALMHLPSRRICWPELGVTGVRSPVISPDGTKLAFVAGEGAEAAVYVCDLALR